MNRSKSKYRYTASLMDQALLLLLEKKPFAYITVKEVCEKAGVHRSTFYLHYETMADLVQECLRNAVEEMQRKYAERRRVDRIDLQACSPEALNLVTPHYLEPYLEFVRENKRLFLAVISQPQVFHADQSLAALYRDLFRPIIDRYPFPEWEKKYRIAFYLNGMWAIIEEWLRADCADAVGQVMALLMRCVYGGGAP